MLVHNSGASCRCEMQNAKSHPSQFARMPRFLTKSTLGSETPCRFLCPDAQGYPLGNSRMHFCILLSPGGWGGLCRREICHIGSFASNKSGMPLRIPFGFLTCQGTSARKFLKVVPHRLKLGIYCYCYVSARRLVTIFLARFLIKECFSLTRRSLIEQIAEAEKRKVHQVVCIKRLDSELRTTRRADVTATGCIAHGKPKATRRADTRTGARRNKVGTRTNT